MSDWKFAEGGINKTPEHMAGFVYLIANTVNGKYYIGRKLFWETRTLPPLKGKKRKRKKTVETKWRDYYGSSPGLLADIEEFGKDAFKREIIKMCRTKTELKYFEAKYILMQDGLLDPDCYNKNIMLTMHCNTLGVDK